MLLRFDRGNRKDAYFTSEDFQNKFKVMMSSDPIELLSKHPGVTSGQVKCPSQVYYELNQLLIGFTVSYGQELYESFLQK